MSRADEPFEGSICIRDEAGVDRHYLLEDGEFARMRIVALKALENSVDGVIDKSTMSHITEGNCFQFIEYVTGFVNREQRGDLVEKLQDEFDKLAFNDDELFTNFVSRFKGLKHRMNEVKLMIDEDLEKRKIEKILTTSGKIVKLAYVTVVMGKEDQPIIEMLEAMVKCVGKQKQFMNDVEDGSESDDDWGGGNKRKNKGKSKHVKELEKKVLDQALALKAQAWENRSQNRSGGKDRFAGTKPNWFGVCSFSREKTDAVLGTVANMSTVSSTRQMLVPCALWSEVPSISSVMGVRRRVTL